MKGQKYETWPQMAFESKRTTTKIQNFVGSNLESPKLMHKLMGKSTTTRLQGLQEK